MKTPILALAAVAQIAAFRPALACTNFLITKGASADGSVMITYSADSHEFYGFLAFKPAGKHVPGTKIDVYEWDTGKLLGQITVSIGVGLLPDHVASPEALIRVADEAMYEAKAAGRDRVIMGQPPE